MRCATEIEERAIEEQRASFHVVVGTASYFFRPSVSAPISQVPTGPLRSSFNRNTSVTFPKGWQPITIGENPHVSRFQITSSRVHVSFYHLHFLWRRGANNLGHWRMVEIDIRSGSPSILMYRCSVWKAILLASVEKPPNADTIIWSTPAIILIDIDSHRPLPDHATEFCGYLHWLHRYDVGGRLAPG